MLTLTRRWDFFGHPWDEGNIGWVRWRGFLGVEVGGWGGRKVGGWGVGRWGFGGAPFVGMEAPGKVRAPSSLLTSGPHIPHRPEPLNADILSEKKN